MSSQPHQCQVPANADRARPELRNWMLDQQVTDHAQVGTIDEYPPLFYSLHGLHEVLRCTHVSVRAREVVSWPRE